MNNNEKAVAVRPLSEWISRRLFSSVPTTWDEVEELLPSLNRSDAGRYLNGELTDRNRAALYDALFAYHPGLRAVLRPEEALPEPPSVIVFRRVGGKTQPAVPPLQAAAKQAVAPIATLCFRADDGTELTLFPSNRYKDRHVVSFANGRPRGTVTLYVLGEPLDWRKDLDEDGRGFLDSSALADVLNGTANLEMIIEPDEDEG